MKYLYTKNIKNLNILKNIEFYYIKLKYFLYNQYYTLFIRQKILSILNKFLNYKKLFIHIKFRCFLTNRSRAYFNFFKISRIKLRQLNSFGIVNGIKKAS